MNFPGPWNSEGNGLFSRKCKNELYDKVTMFSGRLPVSLHTFPPYLLLLMYLYLPSYSRICNVIFYLSLLFIHVGMNIEDILPSYLALIFIFYRFYISCDILMWTLFCFYQEQCTSLLSIFPYLWFRLVTFSFEVLSSIRVSQNKTNIFRGNYVNGISFTLI